MDPISSATSRSSRTSTTASRRSPTGSSSSPARCRRARWKRRCSTRWISSASAASPSRRIRSGCNYTVERRRAVRAQPDRHAGARRLLVRGHAVAGRLRGRAAAGGRLAGRRGADAGQRLSGGREQPRDHPGHQQDRSARRAARRGAPPDRGHHRPRRRRARCWPAPRWAPASPEILEAIVERLPPPGRRSRRAAQGADLRLLVRPLPRRRHRRPRDRRHAAAGHEDPADGGRAGLRVEQVGIFTPKAVAVEELGVGEVGFLVANIKKISDAKIGDTITESRAPDARAVSRLQGAEADGVRRALSGRRARVSGAARRAREAAAERRVVLLRARDVGRRSASGSAAGFSACCTWRSSRSGSSASSTWTWSRRRRACCTG